MPDRRSVRGRAADRLDRAGRLCTEPGRASAPGDYDGDSTRAAALPVLRSGRLPYDRRDPAEHRRILAERFTGTGWEGPNVLRALEAADDLSFDAIAQIHVDRLT